VQQQLPEGTIRRSKRTGATEVFQGGQWVPQGGGAAPQPQGMPTEIRGDPKPADVRSVGDSLVSVDGTNVTPIYTAPPKPEKAPKVPLKSTVALAGRRESIQTLENSVNEIEQLYGESFKGKGIGSIAEYAPGFIRPENANFDNAGRSLMGNLASAMGLTAQQQNTPTELEVRFGPFMPKASDTDEVIEGKIKRLREFIAAQRREADAQGEVLGSPAPEPQAAPQQADESRNVGEIGATPQQQLAPATGETQTVDNPALAGVHGRYKQMLSSGASAGELINYLRSAGVPLDAKVVQSVADQVKFRRANPQIPVENYNTNALDDMTLQMGGMESAVNQAAQSPAGAYVARAGNAMTGNNMDSIAGALGGNPEQVRQALDYAGQEHPLASFAGDLSGGVASALGGEAALARAGMGAGLGRALIADSAYGAAAGAGAADDGSRIAGAGAGLAAGAAGSLGGRALARGGASVVSPTGGNMAKLYETGVRPTPGQRLGSAEGGVRGILGKAVNATEEGISSVPLVGSAIRGARQNARDQFQVGAFNESLKEIGLKLPKDMGPGTAPHAFAQKAFDRAYEKARSGLRLVADDDLKTQVTEIGAQANNLSEPSAKRFANIVSDIVIRRASKSPVMDGATYKKVHSDLGRIIRGIRKNPSGDGELADLLSDMQSALDGAARRNSSPKAVKALDAADRGYAKFVRIEKASAARGGEPGTFTPTQFDRSIQSESGRVRSREYLAGDALMQDYADQGMGLVDRMPNSGSADRVFAGGTLAGGLGFLEPNALLTLGGIGALYAPGIRNALTGSMAPRGQAAQSLAEEIRRHARLGGAAGASGALSVTQSRGGQ
jgi:hypothetical protein